MRPEPVQHSLRIDDVDLCYFEWGARGVNEPTTLLVHATGFHARCWDRITHRLDGHVIAVETRGHGRSSKVPPYDWRRFGADLAGFVAALDLRDVVGAGHSMGGHCVVQAAAKLPERFARLVLLDPVILSPQSYVVGDRMMAFPRAEDHPTSKRRNQWTSVAEFEARFRGERSPFARWDEGVLHDYCQHGLLPDPDGPGFVLACPPIVEASVYMGSSGSDIYDAIATIKQPVAVLRAPPRDENSTTMDFAKSPTWPQLASRFPNGRDVFLPERTHYIPMEDPALAADYIAGRR